MAISLADGLVGLDAPSQSPTAMVPFDNYLSEQLGLPATAVYSIRVGNIGRPAYGYGTPPQQPQGGGYAPPPPQPQPQQPQQAAAPYAGEGGRQPASPYTVSDDDIPF